MINKTHVTSDRINWQDKIAKTSTYLIVLFLLCFKCDFSYSQTIAVKASIDKNTILIGEPIRLRLEAILPVGINAKWFPLDTIPHFDFIEHAPIDTANKPQTRLYRQVVTITSFDSGRWMIPAMPLEVNDKLYMTDSLPVSVGFSPFDPSKDYHDIKDIFEVENPYTKYINWAVAAITLLSLLAIIYLLRKRAAKPAPAVQKPLVRLPPFDEAMRSLEELKKLQLPVQGQAKLFYTRLNDILKTFLQHKTAATVLEKTNEEVVLLLKPSGIPNDPLITLAQTLRLSDAVKFAKFIPEQEDYEKSFQTIRTSIELLNNIYH